MSDAQKVSDEDVWKAMDIFYEDGNVSRSLRRVLEADRALVRHNTGVCGEPCRYCDGLEQKAKPPVPEQDAIAPERVKELRGEMQSVGAAIGQYKLTINSREILQLLDAYESVTALRAERDAAQAWAGQLSDHLRAAHDEIAELRKNALTPEEAEHLVEGWSCTEASKSGNEKLRRIASRSPASDNVEGDDNG